MHSFVLKVHPDHACADFSPLNGFQVFSPHLQRTVSIHFDIELPQDVKDAGKTSLRCRPV